MTAKTKTEAMFSLVDRWKTSDTTQQQFCAEHNLKLGTLSYWVAKRRWTDQLTGGFAAVDVTGVGSSDRIIMTYPNGVTIRLSSGNLPLISQLIYLA